MVIAVRFTFFKQFWLIFLTRQKKIKLLSIKTVRLFSSREIVQSVKFFPPIWEDLNTHKHMPG